MASLREVCENVVMHGGAVLVQLAIQGKLRPSHLWVGVRGAGRYAKAIASGDVASDQVVQERLCGERGCLSCPCVTSTTEPGGYVAHWCGTPLTVATDDDGGTCGCLVEAKASVASEACPRRRWGPSVLRGEGGAPPPLVGSLYT